MSTRSQTNMILAHNLVSSVGDDGVRESYGRLCHSFPVMVRTCGLCQSLTFSLDKGSKQGSNAEAHRLIIEHVGMIIGIGGNQEGIIQAVSSANTREYMLYTRQVLDAWIYFKRFAVSILGVDVADVPRDSPE